MWQMLIPAITGVLDKIIPDPQQAAQAKLEAIKIAQAGEFKELDALLELARQQNDINREEAKTDNFRGGWRPAVGWTCVAGLSYQFIVQPLLPWLVTVAGGSVPPLPTIDNETLMVLLTGMLGLGGFRTLERIKGKV